MPENSTPMTTPALNLNPPIWNPNAAANWSLVFTPAFGSYLHMLNWQTLGEAERARSCMRWFYVSIGMLLAYIFMGVVLADETAADGATRGLALVFLLTWYFASARSQAKYVKAKFGASYARRPWGKALLIGITGFVAFVVAAFLAGVILAMTSGT